MTRVTSLVNAFDDNEIVEKSHHTWYIKKFRVHKCSLYAQGTCPHGDFQCFDAHSDRNRRRKPVLQHGRFNYIPTRCRYVAKDKFCPQGIHCRFSHTTEEMIYHPSKYKTKLCSYTQSTGWDPQYQCVVYGTHCAKAHHPSDLRSAVYEPPGIHLSLSLTYTHTHTHTHTHTLSLSLSLSLSLLSLLSRLVYIYFHVVLCHVHIF